MDRVHVQEAPGRVVWMPDRTRLPPQGALVLKSMFIQRCISDGDLIVVTASPAAAAPASDTAAEHGQ